MFAAAFLCKKGPPAFAGGPFGLLCDYSSAKYLMVRTIWLV